MLNGKNEIELGINAEPIRLIANTVIFYNATPIPTFYQYCSPIDPEKAKEIIHFSTVIWQHIDFIVKYH